MKKFSLFLAVLMIFSLCNCSQKPIPSENPDPPITDELPEETPLNELMQTLSATPYSNSNLISYSYGLDAADKVGIDQQKFENEIKYPVLADSEFSADAIFSVTDLTRESLVLAISQAKAVNASGKKVKIKLPEGRFQIDISSSDFAIEIRGFDGLHLEGRDTTLVIESNGFDNWKGGIIFDNCKDLHVQGINIDYLIQPSFSAKVTSSNVSAKQIVLELNEQFADFWMDKGSITVISYVEYDRFTGGPREGGNYYYLSDIASTVINGNNVTVTFNKTITAPPVGTQASLAMTMYGKAGININKCENVTLESINIYSCPSMGYTAVQSHNVYFNRTNVCLQKGSESKMTATADAMHIVHCTGDVQINNSLVENTHDDALNIKCGYYMKIKSIDFANSVLAVDKIQPDNVLPLPGAKMEAYDADLNLKGSFEIVSASEAGSTYTLKVKGNIYSYQVGMLVSDVSVSPNFLYSNNLIRNKRNRGLLVQVRGGEISNNAFENIVHGALSIHSEIISGAYESMMPKDIVVKNNKFLNNSTDITIFTIGQVAGVANAGAIKDITVDNNYFYNTHNYAVSIGSATDSTIEHNLFRNTARSFSSETNNCAVLIDNSVDITLKDNYNFNDLGSSTFTGIKTIRATDRNRISLVNNVGLGYGGKAETLPPVSISKGGSFVIDGNLSDWETGGTAIDIIGESLASGVEFNNYKNEFNVEMLKVAWTDNGLYFAAKIFDNKLNFKSAANFWTADCIEMFLSDTFMDNADYALVKTLPNASCAQIGLGSFGAATYSGRTSSNIKPSEWTFKYLQTASGYNVELFMPFSSLGGIKQNIDEGNQIGWTIVVGDAERNEINRVRLQVANVGHFVEEKKVFSDRSARFLFVE